MDADDESELQSLLLTFRAHREPGKLTPTKGSLRSPQLSRSSASAAAYSPGHSVTPLPSPLSAYAPSAAQSDDRDVSEQIAALISQPIRLSKEEQAEAIVLSLIQDRATGVDWDCEPQVSNLRSLFRLEHEKAVEMLGVWYPCINEKRLSRAVERYRCKMEKEEGDEVGIQVTEVKPKVGTSFDAAIVMDDEQELGAIRYKTDQSFDSAIVIDDDNESRTSKFPTVFKQPALRFSEDTGEEQPSKAWEKAGKDYPSPSKTPAQHRISFLHVDRTSTTPQQRTVKATQSRAKRAKLIKPDSHIEIPNVVLRAQQNDASGILNPKGSTLLPRDPMVLALLSERKDTFQFLANVFKYQRRQLVAPKIRGIPSVDVIKRSGIIKLGLECEDEIEELY